MFGMHDSVGPMQTCHQSTFIPADLSFALFPLSALRARSVDAIFIFIYHDMILLLLGYYSVVPCFTLRAYRWIYLAELFPGPLYSSPLFTFDEV